MKNLSDYYGQTLIFTQPSVWKRSYVLKYNDEVISVVNSAKLFGLKLEVEMFNNKWTLYRPSIWRSEIGIRESIYTLPFAKYKKEKFKSRGVVELPKGERLKIVFKAFKNEYEIQNSSGQVMVKLVDKIRFRVNVEIFIEKRSEVIDKYPWIIILAWLISAQRKHAALAG